MAAGRFGVAASGAGFGLRPSSSTVQSFAFSASMRWRSGAVQSASGANAPCKTRAWRRSWRCASATIRRSAARHESLALDVATLNVPTRNAQRPTRNLNVRPVDDYGGFWTGSADWTITVCQGTDSCTRAGPPLTLNLCCASHLEPRGHAVWTTAPPKQLRMPGEEAAPWSAETPGGYRSLYLEPLDTSNERASTMRSTDSRLRLTGSMASIRTSAMPAI